MPFRPIRTTITNDGHASPRARTRPTSSPRCSSSPSSAILDAETAVSAKATPATKRPHHKVDRTGPNWISDGDYVVGKRRPPKATQWKKGQSGNPRGPIKRQELSAEQQFERTFLAPFNATVNGETVPLTMDMFAVQSLKNSAAKGSVRAAQILLDLYVMLSRKVAEQEPADQMESWEQETIDRLLEELGLPKRPVVRQTDRSVPRP